MTPKLPKLTDEAIGRMPLESARAELLEEIMSTDSARSHNHDGPGPTSHRHRRWVIPAAAAAAVAALAISTALYRSGPGQDSSRSTIADSAPSASATPTPTSPPAPGLPAPTRAATVSNSPAAVAADYRAVLRATGWTVISTESQAGDYGEIDYGNGKQSLGITWYAADSYDSYVEDRKQIVDPPAPGQPVEVMSASGQMWAYSSDDHTTIREVRAGHWMEIRGSGMSEAAYADLLGQLQLVDTNGLEASLPATFVTTDHRGAAIQTFLDGIDDAMGPARGAFPMGVNPQLHSDESDPYQLGAYVAGQVTCAWLDQYVAAHAAGDQNAASDAVEAMGTARQWPVLQQMNAQGDYPEVVWEYADDIAAGTQPSGYEGALGCSS